MTGWGRDLRFAVRSLRRRPGFTALTTLTLGLGIGLNAAVFGLVDRILLEPPPYGSPEELVLVWNARPGSDSRIPVAAPDVAFLQERTSTLDAVAFALRALDGSLQVGAADRAHHVRLSAATTDFFSTLGVRPRLGRLFDEGDGPAAVGDENPPPPTVVISSDLWRRSLDSDPGAIGRTVRLNGMVATVVGVLPSDFRLTVPPGSGVSTDVDVWTPFVVPLGAFHRRGERLLDQDSDNAGVVVARLAPGATIATAGEEMAGIAGELRREVPQYGQAGLDLRVRPVTAEATEGVRDLLVAVTVGVALVLVVVCLNLATLTLARGFERSRELAVRRALGAGRAAVVRQLLAESVVLAGLGTLLALGLAQLGSDLLSGLLPQSLAWAGEAGSGAATLLAALALGAGTVLLFGLIPALRLSGREAGGGLRGGTGVHDGQTERLRSLLVTGEVALSVVLIFGAGLLLRTVAELRATDPGFEREGALAFSVALRSPDRYRSPGDRAALMKEIEGEVAGLPGVRSVGLVGALPLSGRVWTQPYGLPGQSESEWRSNRADFRMVSSGYFEALGARVLEGRVFTAHEDLNEDERVVVVDRKLADRIAPGGSALDAVIGIPLDGAPVEARVVGVVEHIRHDRLEEDGREAIYVPYRQEASRDVSFVVRTAGDPAQLGAAVGRVLRRLAPEIPVHDVRTLDDYVADALAPRTFALRLILGFAVLALICAGIGLYGVIRFEVTRRTRDIGVRMAVGATRGQVLRDVMLRGLRMTGWGLVSGAALALVLGRGLESLIHGTGLADPLTWSGVILVVALATVLAIWVPARRASALDPTEALRAE